MIERETDSMPVALTIAGFDPSGGAGIVADIKTFTAFGCFATAAVTSLTFQNTVGVFGAVHQTAEAVRAQVLPIIEDFEVACVKTGMLPTSEIIMEVARLFRVTSLPAPVVDPVVRSTSGYDLIDDDALNALTTELFPLARLITPNIPEAERLTGLSITNEEEMRRAARRLREMGARAVLIKGGHLESKAEGGRRKAEGRRHSDVDGARADVFDERKAINDVALLDGVIDLLDDEGRVKVFRGKRVETTSTHGTGCTLAAAIAACLGRGMNLEESVAAAKRFVTDALRRAPGIGRGHGPINHAVRVE